MLDVHPAPHAASSWREFLVHILTIVIGLLIAIGLEQIVVHFHEQHLGREIEKDLREESVVNARVIRYDMASVQSVRHNIRGNMTRLDQVLRGDGKEHFTPSPPTHDTFLPVLDSAWLTLRDNGLMSLVTPEIAHGYWKVEFLGQDINDNLQSLAVARRKVNSLLHLHGDTQELTAEERHELLLAYSDEDQALGNLNYILIAYNYLNQAAIEGRTPSIADLAAESIQAQQHEGEPVY
jgi:hypothetical protein